MKRIILIILILAAFIVVSSSTFVLHQTQQSVIVQFGRPVRSITEPGLHFKIPLIQDARIFDKRILEWDGRPRSLTTLDKVSIYIDAVARWKIADPLLYLETVEGNELIAQARLDNFIEGAVKDFIADNTLIELVRTSNRDIVTTGIDEFGVEVRSTKETPRIEKGRNALANEILIRAKKDAALLGIELVDVRIKGVNYVESVRQKVYERMRAERMQIAARFRSLGEGEKSRILGDMEFELKTIISGADRKALEIMGKADAKATAIYARAYNRDPEFYSFTKTLDTYRSTLGKNTSLVMSSENEFLKYLKGVK
ncbi:MAG: protease modulator HflC [Candidatus Marinimicrobia bacterium]|nr:protease modulator HflC [Candidatus Neomarinimicrobiota bacterium]MCH7955202.1 protease modulator HflC [Candidatus Neomarinimicrobiota bacterium]